MADINYEKTNGNYPLNVRQPPVINAHGDITSPHEELSYLYKPKKRKKKKRSLKRATVTAEENIPVQRIDFVLAYKKEDTDDFDEKDMENYQKRNDLRARFQDALKEQKLAIWEEEFGEYIYLLIHAPFARLCEQAEDVKLEMPLKDAAIKKKEDNGCLSKIKKKFVTDDEVDFVSAAFIMQKRSVYEGINEPDLFFSPSHRSYLVHNILINIDINKLGEGNVKDRDSLRRQGLPFMLMKKVYTDAFILHEESPYADLSDDEADDLRKENQEKEDFDPKADPREEMQRTWCRWWKFQPLWKIRNYFGEKVAFYFSWAGCMASMLWIPMLLGLAIWGYGLFLSAGEYQDKVVESNRKEQEHRDLVEELEQNISLYNKSEDIELLENITSPEYEDSFLSDLTEFGLDMLKLFQDSFDSEVTPYFALIMCLWGTIFQEIVKRKNVRLAYEWDVDEYENTEPDRPEFYGTKERPDPVSDLPDWYYPFYRQFLKFVMSFSILIFMVLLVIASVLGVIVYRVIVGFLLMDSSSVKQIMLTSLVSSVLNTFSIMIFGKIYEYIAYQLTDWENHRTQTLYENALIIKLFAFQFVNSYSSLFYIAFFRNLTVEDGIFNLGSKYADACPDGNCMSMLSLQVFTLMVFKPFPKFSKDIIIPWLKKKWKRWKCCGEKKVNPEEMQRDQHYFLVKEHQKPPVGNFTLAEYTEKVIMYGFLMLFSCSMPMAPLIALAVLLIDIRIDAKRLLWFNQRPISFIACNIGMWFAIVDFLNFAGVVTNAFLIAFTAQWGREKSLTAKLWIIIAFEHIVFVVKLVIALMIPDTPKDIAVAIRRERYQVAQALDSAENQEPLSYEDASCVGRPRPFQSTFKGFNYYSTHGIKHENKTPPVGQDHQEQYLDDSRNSNKIKIKNSNKNLYPLGSLDEKPSQEFTPRSLLEDAE